MTVKTSEPMRLKTNAQGDVAEGSVQIKLVTKDLQTNAETVWLDWYDSANAATITSKSFLRTIMTTNEPRRRGFT